MRPIDNPVMPTPRKLYDLSERIWWKDYPDPLPHYHPRDEGPHLITRSHANLVYLLKRYGIRVSLDVIAKELWVTRGAPNSSSGGTSEPETLSQEAVTRLVRRNGLMLVPAIVKNYLWSIAKEASNA